VLETLHASVYRGTLNALSTELTAHVRLLQVCVVPIENPLPRVNSLSVRKHANSMATDSEVSARSAFFVLFQHRVS